MRGVLQDRVVLVTGGGSGLGRSAALQLAAAGARVVVADLDAAAAEQTVAAIADQGAETGAGAEAEAAVFDVTNPAAHEAAVARAVAAWGRLDGAFNSAGFGGPLHTRMLDMDLSAWRQTLEVNLSGLWFAMRAQVAQMREQQAGGSIVNAASVARIEGRRGGNAAYNATKHAVLGLTRSVAEEYAESKVRVNAVCPGWSAAPAAAAAAYRIRAAYTIGQGQDEAAAAVVWLMSDAATFMTGAVLPVDVGDPAAAQADARPL